MGTLESCSFIDRSIEFSKLSSMNPASIIVPAAWVSGRFTELRRYIPGKLRMADYLLVVPLSDRVHKVFILRLT
jgi:hypothetical protein